MLISEFCERLLFVKMQIKNMCFICSQLHFLILNLCLDSNLLF